MTLYRLKPLEWKPSGDRHFVSVNLLGRYIVYFAHCKAWQVHDCDTQFGSSEAAKAACQADYEKRMLEFLEPVEEQP